MYAGIWEIDLHGKNEYQARVTLDAALRRVRPGTYRIRVIHGHHGGAAGGGRPRRDGAGTAGVLRKGVTYGQYDAEAGAGSADGGPGQGGEPPPGLCPHPPGGGAGGAAGDAAGDVLLPL